MPREPQLHSKEQRNNNQSTHGTRHSHSRSSITRGRSAIVHMVGLLSIRHPLSNGSFSPEIRSIPTNFVPLMARENHSHRWLRRGRPPIAFSSFVYRIRERGLERQYNYVTLRRNSMAHRTSDRRLCRIHFFLSPLSCFRILEPIRKKFNGHRTISEGFSCAAVQILTSGTDAAYYCLDDPSVILSERYYHQISLEWRDIEGTRPVKIEGSDCNRD
jgi:hypothetical protein